MAIGTGKGEVEFFEDFERNNVTDLNEVVVDSATQDITPRHGGWWRQVLAGDNADAVFLGAERAWETDEGPGDLVFEWRGYSTDADVSSVFVGLSDDQAQSGAVVIEDEDGTLNTVATDAVGFLLEGERVLNPLKWQAVGVQNNVDNPQVTLTSGPAASDSGVQTLRMLLSEHNSGNVKFYIGGDLVSSQNSFHDSSIVYVPVISSDDRGTAYNFDTDYFYTSAPRS